MMPGASAEANSHNMITTKLRPQVSSRSVSNLIRTM